MFNNYPYTNFHEQNQDWIMQTVKEANAKSESADNKADEAVSTANVANAKSDVAVSTSNSANAKSDNAVAISAIANATANSALAYVQSYGKPVAELQALGYTVPSECPIQNVYENGVLIQKVGRVDLGSLTWRFSDGKNCFMHERVIPALTQNLYCTKYTEVTSSRNLNDMEMSTTGWASPNELNIRDDSCNGNASLFTSSNAGIYLYYELAEYKTLPITNGVESSAPVSDHWDATKTYSVNSFCIYNNALYKCIVQNTNTLPTNVSYWSKTSVAEQLTYILSQI